MKTQSDTCPSPTPASLLRVPASSLDALYEASPVGPIPVGDMRGTAIFFPGTIFTRLLAPLVRLIAWQGKVFDPKSGTLLNRILPFGLFRAIKARVYRGASKLVTGGESTVLDYSALSPFPFSTVRDEIREVAPGLFMGPVYIKSWKVLYFMLERPSK